MLQTYFFFYFNHDVFDALNIWIRCSNLLWFSSSYFAHRRPSLVYCLFGTDLQQTHHEDLLHRIMEAFSLTFWIDYQRLTRCLCGLSPCSPSLITWGPSLKDMWCKKITDSQKLSSGLHTHFLLHAHMHVCMCKHTINKWRIISNY